MKNKIPAIVLFTVFIFISLGFINKCFPEETDINVIQTKYIKYGLMPLTESPGENEPDYRIWQDAFETVKKLDKAVSKDPDWQNDSKREALVKKRLLELGCNEKIRLFNLGHFGNRFYSVISGIKKDGETMWNCDRWFLYNPSDGKDIGPRKKHPSIMKMFVSGNKVKGEFKTEKDRVGVLEGILDNEDITYTLTFSGQRTVKKTGMLHIRTPLYIFGDWFDEPRAPKNARGEWEFRKINE